VSDTDPLLERLSRAAEAVTGDDQRATTFARGLILGALVGAAIAGSTLWQRRRQAGLSLPAAVSSAAVPGDEVAPDR
jgi:hypothetical protein